MFIKIIYTVLIFGISSSLVSAGTVDDAQSMLNRLSYDAGQSMVPTVLEKHGALEEYYAGDNGGSYDGKLVANEITDLQAAINSLTNS